MIFFACVSGIPDVEGHLPNLGITSQPLGRCLDGILIVQILDCDSTARGDKVCIHVWRRNVQQVCKSRHGGEFLTTYAPC